MKIAERYGILGDPERSEIARSVRESPLDPPSREPARKRVRVVIASASPSLIARRAAELGRPDDDRIVQQTERFQIDQQTRDGLIDSTRRNTEKLFIYIHENSN